MERSIRIDAHQKGLEEGLLKGKKSELTRTRGRSLFFLI